MFIWFKEAQSCVNMIFFLLFYLIVKQWLLAREFSECEYSHSPKWLFSEICETRQTRQHLPNHFARTCQTRQNLPKAIFEKNVTRLAKFAQVIRETRGHFASSHCLLIVQNSFLQFGVMWYFRFWHNLILPFSTFL
jgi:hypothetical protein